MIEIGKAKEGVYILDFHWYRPLFDAFDLDRVHFNGVLSDDHSQILHFGEVEMTLL